MAMTLRPRVDGPPAPAPAPQSFSLLAKFEQRRGDIEAMLPKGVTFERVMGELYLACRRNDKLEKVPVDLLIDAVGRALATEGVIDQDVYIVPFWSTKKNGFEVSVIVDYKYLAELVIAAGGARSITMRVVWEHEPFEVHYGTDERIEHRPLDPGARGANIKGAYAIAKINGYLQKFEWMPLEDIEAIRKTSKQWGPDKSKAPIGWYCKKTVVRQLVKLLPKSPRLRAIARIVEEEEVQEFGHTFDAARAIPATIEDDDVRMNPTQLEPTDISGMEEAPADDAAELSEALATVVQKRALGDVRNSRIVAIQKWAAEKLAADPGGESATYLAWIDRACQLILNARADGTLQEPPKKADAA